MGKRQAVYLRWPISRIVNGRSHQKDSWGRLMCQVSKSLCPQKQMSEVQKSASEGVIRDIRIHLTKKRWNLDPYYEKGLKKVRL